MPNKSPLPTPKPALGITIERLDVATSTNDLARTAIEAGTISNPHVWIARIQTAARGRLGRTWHAPEGGLWLTAAWPPKLPTPSLGIRLGAACLDTISQCLRAHGVDPSCATLKWPNDIYIHNKKCSGILTETAHDPLGKTWLIVGVGINVNNSATTLPQDIAQCATSLRTLCATTIDRELLLNDLIAHLDAQISEPEPLADLIARIAPRLYKLDESISITDHAGTTAQGILRGLTNDGQAVLETNGKRIIITSGTIESFPDP